MHVSSSSYRSTLAMLEEEEEEEEGVFAIVLGELFLLGRAGTNKGVYSYSQGERLLSARGSFAIAEQGERLR